MARGVWAIDKENVWHWRRLVHVSTNVNFIARTRFCHTPVAQNLWREEVPPKPAVLCEKCSAGWSDAFLKQR